MLTKTIRTLNVLLLLGLFSLSVFAQREQPIPRSEMLTIDEYEPKSTLVVKETKPMRAKFPLIDIHSHQALTDPARIDKLVKEMDEINL